LVTIIYLANNCPISLNALNSKALPAGSGNIKIKSSPPQTRRGMNSPKCNEGEKRGG